jgi:hypothetical protein
LDGAAHKDTAKTQPAQPNSGADGIAHVTLRQAACQRDLGDE